MTKDNARSIAGQALSDLAKQLEQGKSQSLMTFLDTLAKFHRYSFGNVLLIGMQSPAAIRVIADMRRIPFVHARPRNHPGGMN